MIVSIGELDFLKKLKKTLAKKKCCAYNKIESKMKLNYKPAIFVFKMLIIIAVFFILHEISGKGYSTSFNVSTGTGSYLQHDYLAIAQKEIDSRDRVRAIHELPLQYSVHSSWGDLICRGNTNKEIALTFDDGPHPGYTEKLLAILSEYNVKATFFVVGKKAAQHPQLVREFFNLGHSIGNHTYSHIDLSQIHSDDIAVEIKACGKVLYDITGKYCDLFRPPGGNFNRRIEKTALNLGYTSVLWTANSADYSNISKNAVRRRIYSRIGNGGIILMHDGIQKTLDILPGLISSLKSKGYHFVTVDEIRSNRYAYRYQTAKKIEKPILPAASSQEASLIKIQYAQ